MKVLSITALCLVLVQGVSFAQDGGVYSPEYVYDNVSDLVGKTVTIKASPTGESGSDSLWKIFVRSEPDGRFVFLYAVNNRLCREKINAVGRMNDQEGRKALANRGYRMKLSYVLVTGGVVNVDDQPGIVINSVKNCN